MNELSQVAAENLLNGLPIGMAICLFAWAASRTLRESGSAIRFAIWFGALAAIVVLPWAGSLRDTSYRALPALQSAAIALPGTFAAYLVAAWLVGASLGLLHVAFGLYRLSCVRATCEPVALSGLDPLLQKTLAGSQSGRRIMLLASDAVRVPAAFGYFRPAVVFPKWALAEINPNELNAILLHELAHLQRFDDWTNLAQKMVKAVLFFHPAVWFIESRLTLEREMACDDAVLAANFNPRSYAESLVGLAEKSYLRRGIQLAQAAVGHVQQLKLRLAEILRKDRSADAGVRVARPAVAVLAIAGVLGSYAAVRAPRLVAFGASSAASEVASDHMPASVNKLAPTNASLTMSSVREPRKMIPRAPVKLETRKDGLVIRRADWRRVPEDPQPPALLLTSTNAAMTLPVVLVFQAQQFGSDGSILWRVTVFHLTPYQQQVLTGQIPKQI